MSAVTLPVLYPWQHAQFAQLTRDLSRLPHALLFTGPSGVGKNAFAACLAHTLLCTRPGQGGAPCGRCQNCQLYGAASHPDLHVVQPDAITHGDSGLSSVYALRYVYDDKPGKARPTSIIAVDQVRTVIAASQLRPQIAGRKVVLLTPAEAMNASAANSLLKFLEEPPADSVILLVSSKPARLPATVRSRCARIALPTPEPGAARAWLATQAKSASDAALLLELAGGTPLTALALAETGFLAERDQLMADVESLSAGHGDPIACAARWRSLGTERCLTWLQGWVSDLIKLGMRSEPARLFNPDARARLQAQEKRLNLSRLFRFLEVVTESRALLTGPLDELLLLEDVLIRWTRTQ